MKNPRKMSDNNICNDDEGVLDGLVDGVKETDGGADGATEGPEEIVGSSDGVPVGTKEFCFVMEQAGSCIYAVKLFWVLLEFLIVSLRFIQASTRCPKIRDIVSMNMQNM